MLISRNRQKLIQAAVYFALNTQGCGKVKLFKLLYLLDFAHFRETGRNVTGLDYVAWKLGPVPLELAQEWDQLDPDLAAAVDIIRRRSSTTSGAGRTESPSTTVTSLRANSR